MYRKGVDELTRKASRWVGVLVIPRYMRSITMGGRDREGWPGTNERGVSYLRLTFTTIEQ
jgi:hypothetical protein